MLSPTTCGAPPAAIHSLCAGGTISFGLRSRPSKLASTTGRIEFTWWPHDGHGVTAWSFSSRCSPPGVVAPMQLRSDTGLPVSARSGTLTLLSKSALRRTRAGFHPAPSFWNDEAIEHSLRACFKNRPVRGPGLQGFVILAVSRRPRALTRRPPTILKDAPSIDLSFVQAKCDGLQPIPITAGRMALRQATRPAGFGLMFWPPGEQQGLKQPIPNP